MDQSEFSLTSNGGRNLYVKGWTPQGEIKAVIVLVHGFGEHCSRYNPYFELFEKFGIAFIGYDQYGHGKSAGKRGAIQSYQQLLDDVSLVIAKAEEQFPHIPKFLYGHSMGGNIAFNYLLQKSHSLRGGIITSPWFQLFNEPSAVIKTTVSIIKHIVPNVTVNSNLDTKYISTITNEVEKYNQDELNHGRISFRLMDAVTRQGRWAIENANKLTVPTLMMHGTADEITAPVASALASKGNEKLIEYVTWPEMYHELHNDMVREAMAENVAQWVLKVCEA